MTILLGIIGSFVGGFLGQPDLPRAGSPWTPAGIIGSIIGAIIVLLIYTRVRARGARA